MIKLQVGEIINMEMALSALSNVKMSSGADALKIARILAGLEPEVKIIDRKRQEIITKYCERDDDGNPKLIESEQGQGVKIDPQYASKINEEFMPFAMEEIEINAKKLPISVFESLTDLSAADIMKLSPIIEEAI